MKKSIYNIKIIYLILILLLIIFTTFCNKKKINTVNNNIKTTTTKKFKILHIMSYHSPWEWTDKQFNGFKEPLKDLNIEYKVFQMDTKRKSSKEWIDKVSKEARNLIDNWKPDLVYTNDDNAQKYVTQYYINKSIPFVFSGVNADPQDYGFLKSKNIAGVLEQEHFVESVKLLKEIIPDLKNIAVITDTDVTWPAVIKRMKEKAPRELRDINFISWDIIYTFEEYKLKIKEYEKKVDAFALLGIFMFKDKNGNNVHLEDVAKWTAENSMIPEFTFWEDRIYKGHLCAVTVSAYEQGYAAGKIAREILINNKKPVSFPFEATKKGEPIISLARANKLGLKIKSDLLLSVKVIQKYEWQE